MHQSILSLTKKLISIPSVNGDSGAINEVLQVVKQELAGFTIEEFSSNNIPSILVYNGPTRPEKFKILLNGHLDVVPGNKDQFTPSEKKGKLYGRGASDMKSGAAIIIFLFKELAKKVSYPLGLQIVCDEEVGGHDGTLYQIKQGVKADFVIAAETTNLRIVHQAKGVIWAKITTKGKSAHGARPWEGDNPIWKMRKILDQLQKDYATPKESVWQTTVNATSLSTPEQTHNRSQGECSLFLDVRYIPEDKQKILTYLNSFKNDHTMLETEFVEPVHVVNKDNEYIIALEKEFKSIMKRDAHVDSNPGASDVRHFTDAGYPGIVFGPVGGGFHADDEWASIQGFEDYYQILKNFLLAV